MLNYKHYNFKLLLPTALITILLSACGGGGGGSDSAGGGFTAATSNANAKPQVSSSSSAESSSSSSTKSLATSSATSSKAPSKIDTTAPSAPSSLIVTAAASDMIALNWSAAQDNIAVTSYRIYRDQIQIDTVDTFTYNYNDYNVAPGKSYTFGISAGDSIGNWSTIKTITAQAPQAPAPSNSSTASSTNASSVSSTSPTNSSAASAASSSAASSLDKTPPSTPSALNKDIVKANQVSISWPAATDNIAVTQYRIYRDTILVTTANAATLTYSDTTTKASQQYTYSVSAGDAAGNWSSLKTIFVTTPSATQTLSNFTLKWTRPTQRENLEQLNSNDIGGYEIRYKTPFVDTYISFFVTTPLATEKLLSNIPSDAIFEISCYDINNLASQFIEIKPIKSI